MTIDIYQKSAELLEKLANSIYDRDPNNPKPFFFSLNEVHIVEKWLNELLNEEVWRNPKSFQGIVIETK